MKYFVQWIRRNSEIVLAITLILKIILFRSAVIQDLSILGFISDIAIVMIVLALPALICKGAVKSWIQYSLAFILSLIWFATSIYYSYYGSIPTYHTLSNLNQVGQISESVMASIEWYLFLFFIDFLFIGLAMLIWRKEKRLFTYWKPTARKISPRLLALIVTLLGVLICFGSIWGARHIENEHALAKRLGVINYQIAVLIEGTPTSTTEISEAERTQIAEQLQQWFTENEKPEQSLYHGVAANRNLIVLQLEAFQNILMGLTVNDQEITPNLNALIKDSFYFSRVFQQIGEGNTSDAEFMLNTSVYPVGSPAMSHFVEGKEVPSLPRILQDEGYVSYTFHVNDVTFWNRNKMYPALGFTKYFDKPYYVNDQFNSFGASDEQLYKVALEQLTALQAKGQPFYAQLVTVSSHHPFVIPEQYQTLSLPSELVGTQLGNYLQAAHYTDEQIGHFIANLKEAGIWEHSIIAIYGDHFGLQTKDNDPSWVSEQLGVPYHEQISRMNIPFIVTVPGVEGEQIDTVGGQVDMMPTILNLLGISAQEHQTMLFGNDLINTETNIIGSRYYLPTGSFFNDDVLYIPGSNFDTGVALDLTTFERIDNIEPLRKDYEYIQQLMKMSDLYSLQLPKSTNE